MCLMQVALAGNQAIPALQAAVDRAMASKRGTVVVLEVASGRVLAAYRLDIAARRIAYPGSSIKPFTLLALLQTAHLDPHLAVACKRPLNIAGHRLACIPGARAKPGPAHGHGQRCGRGLCVDRGGDRVPS